MGDINMKKLNKSQLRKVILQEMKDLEEARLGKKGKEYIEKTGRFGKLASFGVDRLLQTRLFDEMMMALKQKLFGFGIDPNEMAEIEKILIKKEDIEEMRITKERNMEVCSRYTKNMSQSKLNI